jgi:hypothetical protein
VLFTGLFTQNIHAFTDVITEISSLKTYYSLPFPLLLPRTQNQEDQRMRIRLMKGSSLRELEPAVLERSRSPISV